MTLDGRAFYHQMKVIAEDSLYLATVFDCNGTLEVFSSSLRYSESQMITRYIANWSNFHMNKHSFSYVDDLNFQIARDLGLTDV